MGVRDSVAAFEDVRELLVPIPAWGGIEVLFRGLSFASLTEIQNVNLTAAADGDVDQAIALVQATACEPDTKELAFAGPEGAAILRGKSYESILYCVLNGANLVLGVDPEGEAGKGSSSTVTETPTLDA